MQGSHWKVAAPFAALSLSACFATQNDIRVLQTDLNTVRSEQAASNAALNASLKAQIDRVLLSLGAANDSITAVSNRLTRFRSDMSTSMASIDQQLLAVQELTGQSQQRLQEVRATLEERQSQTPEPAPATGANGNPPAAPTPGPAQLIQAGREQMLQGSNEAARQAFNDLLAKYPKSDLAGDAQFYVAETYAAEGNAAAADSVYTIVSTKYSRSSRAATALYKRGVAAQTADDAATAKKIYAELIKKYPRSDEAALARDRVKALNK